MGGSETFQEGWVGLPNRYVCRRPLQKKTKNTVANPYRCSEHTFLMQACCDKSIRHDLSLTHLPWLLQSNQ
jgi:hypothetical protein